ncbi:heat shock protein 33 [Entomoplasma ellychniae]|uniref:Heat shock protein 33 n=1 Tax=Entomoplasma ellychniae TaxID=2114 RepID=A0A8E2QZ13_9MOLU|nr:Hsp33 family molecular chaperone HslO [Entomoplasma ellychniae]PPE04808.1 heat shock protein 33 [Entomoplasma ellychniae]
MDLQIRAISNKHNAKISIVDISDSINKICDLQQSSPIVNICLAKFTINNTLVAIDNKDNNKISTAYSTDEGVIKRMITEFEDNKIRSTSKVKHFEMCETTEDINPLDLMLGKTGEIYYSRDMGLKAPYISSIKTKGSNMDSIFMQFLKKSSQITSLIATDVTFNNSFKIDKAVGILIQLLPEHTQENIEMLENKIGNTKYLTDVLVKSTNYYEVIKDIFEDAQVLSTSQIIFECNCNYEKIFNLAKLLEKKELLELINNKENVYINCDFCNKDYTIKYTELNKLI